MDKWIQRVEAPRLEKLKKENLLIENRKINKHDFYVSDYTTNFQEKTKLFFQSAIILKEENIFS